ncbi:MAG: oligosaccharide flippase family protein [Chloroflexi bacterium]|nr:oligosaccharide flippase family protein [Chloroflexota bacterium]
MSAATERPPDALRRQVGSAMRWNALLPLRIVLGSLASLVLFNAISKEEYGVIVLVTSLAGLLGTWIDMGVERSLPKFYPEVERDAGRPGLLRFMREIALFKLAVVALLVVGMVLARDWFFGFWASRTSDQVALAQLEEHRWMLFGALVALLVLGAIFDVLMQVLVAFFRQMEFNLINMAASLLQPLLIVGAVVLGLGLPGLLTALVLVPLAAIVMAWSSTRRAIASATGPATGRLRSDFTHRLASYSLTNYGQQLASMVHSFSFAVLFVGGLAAAAEFKFGYYLPSQVLQILFAPFSGLQVPLFARLREQHGPEQTQAVYSQLSRALLLLFCPAALGLAVLAPNLTNILAPQYSAAAPVAALLALCLFGGSLLAVARNLVMVHERYGPVIGSRLIGLVALPLLYVLPPVYGPLGAAVAIGGAGLAAEAVAWVWSMRLLRLRYPWGFAGQVLVGCAAMVAVAWPLATWLLPVPPTLTVAERLGPALVGQVAIAALGTTAFLVVFRLLGGLDPDDRAALVSLRVPGTRFALRWL